MNKLSKVVLVIIFILVIIIGIMTYVLIHTRKIAKDNLNSYLESLEDKFYFTSAVNAAGYEFEKQ